MENEMLEKLRKYLNEIPKEQIQKEWEELEKKYPPTGEYAVKAVDYIEYLNEIHPLKPKQ